MLDAAVCGEVFASPNARQITTGLEAVASDKGFVPALPSTMDPGADVWRVLGRWSS